MQNEQTNKKQEITDNLRIYNGKYPGFDSSPNHSLTIKN